MRARLNGFQVSVMATELRRTSIARLSTDGDNKGARVVAVRYFLDRPGADLTKASVRIYQNPPAAVWKSTSASVH